ncbi:MAG: type I glutamate--ammonia ligase, partial [Deltaproteobacteria bacterium]|nr:type I glutamate--ammonia ligase [Deltaproteobacteria bacterium]
MTPKEVLDMAKENDAKFVDLRFMDFPGLWQHFSVPIGELEESSFEDGFGFDGSSIRGWQPIHASDMLVIPDVETANMDPFYAAPTLTLICNIVDPVTREPYTRDPRNIARKADAYLKSSGIGDVAYIGPEAEFFIFDDIRFESSRFGAFYEIDSIEGNWNTGRDEGPNLGYKPRHKEGYFPVPPMDKFQDLRSEMVLTLEALGIEVEAQHHEVATAGQAEIDMRFKPLLQMSDQLMWFKYVLKNVAYRNNHTVTFMPKPLFEDNGTGMHTHISIWKGDQPLFAGDKYAGVSQEALYAIGGILKHCRALCAFTNPTTNSYKRLVPGFEAPVNLAYSSRNRSAAVRIPMYSTSPKAKRIEFRTPDPSCNGYLAFSGILMAVLDGIQNKIDPGDPLDKDIYNLPPEELAEIPSAPGSLDEALDALKADQEFLLKGDVFTQDA